MENTPIVPPQGHEPHMTYTYAAPAEIETIQSIETHINEAPGVWKLAIKAYELYGNEAIEKQPRLAKIVGFSGVIETIDDIFQSNLDHEFAFDEDTMKAIDSDLRLKQNKKSLNEAGRRGDDALLKQIRLQNRILSMDIYIRRVKQAKSLAQTAVSATFE